jgi:hypothetical protein
LFGSRKTSWGNVKNGTGVDKNDFKGHVIATELNKKDLRLKMKEYGKKNRIKNFSSQSKRNLDDGLDMRSHGGTDFRRKDEMIDFNDGHSFLSLDDNKLALAGIMSTNPSSSNY